MRYSGAFLNWTSEEFRKLEEKKTAKKQNEQDDEVNFAVNKWCWYFIYKEKITEVRKGLISIESVVDTAIIELGDERLRKDEVQDLKSSWIMYLYG